jgi:hypothetical protein
MNATNVTLAVTAAALPAAVAADKIPVPDGVNPLLMMLIMALGPSCVGLLHLFGKTVLLSVSGYFKARSKAKKEQAQKMLSDKDKSNDAAAQKLLVSAEAEEGAAKALEQAALQVKDK